MLKLLLENIQHCQRRYGGNTELATELDSCIVALCSSLETIFLHGLKNKMLYLSEQSKLKHVSAIVTNSFSSNNNEIPTFWPFIKRHLTRHEQERYASLKHVWTNIGYGRAWIRSTLNEHSLERYINMILSRPDILIEYYESWAILLDEEKNSMLPNMAGGLGSILFAISIDKPELNKGLSRNNNHLKSTVEPIIETIAPVFDNKLKKKKAKVAKQYISFDEYSVTSTSDPPCSNNFGSDLSLADNRNFHQDVPCKSVNNGQKGFCLRLEDKFGIENNEKISLRPDISKETDQSDENYKVQNSQGLTMIKNSEMSDFTPVLFETTQNFQSSDNSDDLFSIPSGITSFVNTLQVKNEELRKKDEEIQFILKENENLQQKIKKYVNVIHVLKQNDNTKLDTLLNNLDLDEQTDYEKEAKLFENKLIQIAEMHAELIDFNSTLQKKLSEKEATLEKLKSELELANGLSCTQDLGRSSCVQVWIPSTFLTGNGSSAHHVYKIFLKAGNDEWNIYRRYAQFYALHTELKKLDPVVTTFDFPPKKNIRRKTSAFVEDRRKRLQAYLRKVITHWVELSLCKNRSALEQHLTFFKDKQPIKEDADPNTSRTLPHSSIYTGL